MQRFILTAIFSFCVSFCSIQAQNYHVCDVGSNVCIINKRIKTPVKKMQVINEKELLDISANGYVVLLDSTSMKSYKIDKPCHDLLKNIISTNKATVEQLTARYFQYIWKRMCKGNDVAINSTTYEQRTTGTYRGIDTICVDSTAKTTVKKDSICKTTDDKACKCAKMKCKE